MNHRPVGGFILSLLGGIFSLLGTLIGFAFAPTCGGPYCYVPSYFYPFLLTAGLAGGVVLLGAALLYRRPDLHVVWGVVILVMSATSAVGVITGYFALFGVAGVVLGIVGGSMAIAWGTGEPTSAVGGVRLCQGCGRFVPLAYPFCAFCGTPAPSLRPPSATAPPATGYPPKP